MKQDIPHIKFEPAKKDNIGFEIIPLERIHRDRHKYDHDPEQPHQLNFFKLTFYTKGEGRHFADFNWYPVKQNTLVYHTKEQINAFDFSSNLEGYCIIFTEDYFVNSFSHLPKDFVFRLFNPQLFSPVIQIPDDSEFITFFNILLQEYQLTEGFNYPTILQSLFVILISKAETIKQEQTFHIKDNSKIALFQKFIILLDKHFTSTRSAEDYAKQLHISYKHLNATCKELTNKTAKTIISEYIILQAKRLLINSEIKSAELAYKIGFEDPTNFTKFFKKYTGLTPKAFK